MKCPQCEKTGETSTVEALGTMVTLMGHRRFWGTDGVYHSHDPNTHKSGYRCSNGHEWAESHIAPCPNCDYATEQQRRLDKGKAIYENLRATA